MVTRELLGRLPTLKPGELMAIRASVVEATRKATLLYPNNATLHAELADASSTIGVFADAARTRGDPARRPHAAPGSQAAEGHASLAREETPDLGGDGGPSERRDGPKAVTGGRLRGKYISGGDDWPFALTTKCAT